MPYTHRALDLLAMDSHLCLRDSMPSMVPDGAAAAAASPGPTKHHIAVALTLYCSEKYASGDIHMHSLLV